MFLMCGYLMVCSARDNLMCFSWHEHHVSNPHRHPHVKEIVRNLTRQTCHTVKAASEELQIREDQSNSLFLCGTQAFACIPQGRVCANDRMTALPSLPRMDSYDTAVQGSQRKGHRTQVAPRLCFPAEMES